MEDESARSKSPSLAGEQATPTPEETQAVIDWLEANDGEWKMCHEVEEALPFLRRFFKDPADREEDAGIAAFYFVNDIAALADHKGGIEEHGYDDLFVCADLDNPSDKEDDEEE